MSRLSNLLFGAFSEPSAPPFELDQEVTRELTLEEICDVEAADVRAQTEYEELLTRKAFRRV